MPSNGVRVETLHVSKEMVGKLGAAVMMLLKTVSITVLEAVPSLHRHVALA